MSSRRALPPSYFTALYAATLHKGTFLRSGKGRSNSLSHPNRMSHCWGSKLLSPESITCLDPGKADIHSKYSRPGNDPSKDSTLTVPVNTSNERPHLTVNLVKGTLVSVRSNY